MGEGIWGPCDPAISNGICVDLCALGPSLPEPLESLDTPSGAFHLQYSHPHEMLSEWDMLISVNTEQFSKELEHVIHLLFSF